ncbi:CapA family protein [Streptomyces sp. H10-C2]|uniref:CapA family protein n=1 Tax=unclassified Streptomyces TaxID=2593676 RepID=UPI0024B9394C|nr:MULTISPECIES: CapA family protein [unclassified Streptomyces]MDJ0346882.1 CapA family protein [Streptomyces sp. PH10-H1]MDJ0375170.1 CapA family protein [Streptomyces sp. H10-C2]
MMIRTRHGALAVAVALLGTVTATACGGTAGPQAAPASKRDSGPSAPAGSAPGPKGFTLVASGDVLPHTAIIQQAQADAGGSGYDFHQMLAGVKPVVSTADLAICHMETVYGAKGGPFSGYPTFKSPPEVARALKDTGYDSCSTASNHTLDDGADGVRRTLDAMDAVGVRHAGSARTAAEAGKPALLKAGGATVAQLAYTYDTNGFPQPEGQPWAVNVIEPDRIIADARAARQAGADVVLVSLHWGTEWRDEPDEMQLSVAKKLTAARTGGRSDIDLILGTHAHIPQAYEKVNGTWVVYGMGDQVAGPMFTYDDHQDARGNMGSIARFTFAPPDRAGQRWTVRKAEFIPQLMDLGPPSRVVTLNDALRRAPGRSDYVRARDHIRMMVLSRGGAAEGLTMVP